MMPLRKRMLLELAIKEGGAVMAMRMPRKQQLITPAGCLARFMFPFQY